MSAFPLTRRAAIAALGALVLPSLAEMPSASAQPGLRIRAIKVDVSPIRASMGDPTAAWAEQAASRRARAVAGALHRAGRP
jgi:hypothetical protein